MFEVFAVEGGFRWRFVSANGRCLFEGDATIYPTNTAAAGAADTARTAMWENAKRLERFPGSF